MCFRRTQQDKVLVKHVRTHRTDSDPVLLWGNKRKLASGRILFHHQLKQSSVYSFYSASGIITEC